MAPGERCDVALLQWQGTGGGAERHVIDLAVSTAGLGVHPAVVYFGPPGGAGEELAAKGIPWRALGLASGLDPRGPGRLQRAIDELRPRAVHDHLSTPWTRALLRTHAPLLATEHGNAGLDRYARQPHRRWLERRAARRTRLCLAPSRAMAEAIVDAYGFPEDRIRVVPHGIDPARYGQDPDARVRLRRSLGLEDEILVLFVGRLDEPKGILDLLEAFGRAVRGDATLRLAIAGRGPLASEVARRKDAEGLARQIHLLGFRSDVAAWYVAADVFVLPSRREAFGMVLLEAMASRVAVIGTRAGGIPEIVEDGRTGLLVPAQDPEALAGAILALARDPQKREALARAGSAAVRERFGIERMARATCAVYEEAWRGTR